MISCPIFSINHLQPSHLAGRMALPLMFAVILQSFIKHQGKDIPIYGTVSTGKFVCLLSFILPLAFVCWWWTEWRSICEHYKNYSPNVARLSHICNATLIESNNSNWQCQFLKMRESQSVSIRALELHGFILNEDVIQLPINEKMYEMSHCMDPETITTYAW